MGVVGGKNCRSFRCFYPNIIITNSGVFYIAYKLYTNRFRCSYVRTGTMKWTETFTITQSRWDLLLCQVSSWNSKLNFSDVPEGNHSILPKNTEKIKYLGSNELGIPTFFTVFIARWNVHNAHCSDSKATEQLVTFLVSPSPTWIYIYISFFPNEWLLTENDSCTWSSNKDRSGLLKCVFL